MYTVMTREFDGGMNFEGQYSSVIEAINKALLMAGIQNNGNVEYGIVVDDDTLDEIYTTEGLEL